MDSPNLERGIQLFENGRYAQAISYFQTALAENTDNFITKFYLANCLFQIDDIDNALAMSLELRSLDPNNPNIYFLLSQIHLSKNNISKAEKNIDKAIELHAFEDVFFGQKAYILLALKNFKGALHYANEGLKINAKSSFCLNARTTALTKLNRKSEAKSSIEFLLQDDPEDAHSHANVGWSLLEHNNNKQALIHFKEALILNPNLEYAKSGMVTAIKAKNKIYNLYLRYAFWINNKSNKNQWVFIIGIYIAYRVSIKLLSTTGLTYLAIPLVILYLLFALGSWIMDPLSNMLLLFDKYGKYLLDNNEKLSGRIFIVLISMSFLTFISSLITQNDYFIILSLTFLAVILPLTRGALGYSKKTRIINFIYGAIMVLIAIGGSLTSYPIASIGAIIAFMFIGYTWLGSLILK